MLDELTLAFAGPTLGELVVLLALSLVLRAIVTRGER